MLLAGLVPENNLSLPVYLEDRRQRNLVEGTVRAVLPNLMGVHRNNGILEGLDRASNRAFLINQGGCEGYHLSPPLQSRQEQLHFKPSALRLVKDLAGELLFNG